MRTKTLTYMGVILKYNIDFTPNLDVRCFAGFAGKESLLTDRTYKLPFPDGARYGEVE